MNLKGDLLILIALIILFQVNLCFSIKSESKMMRKRSKVEELIKANYKNRNKFFNIGKRNHY